jgi:hypothetical protein
VIQDYIIKEEFKNIHKLNQIMVKCDICKNKMIELFLDKLKGTVIKKAGSSKKYQICFECQKKFRKKEELLEKL